MPYLNGDVLQASVSRLGTSRAQSRLADWLIFKRAAVRTTRPDARSNGAIKTAPSTPKSATVAAIKWPVHVVSGMKSLPFVDAIRELASATADASTEAWPHQPFFVPFGASRDSARGYKTRKYPSNGPDNTVQNWQTQGFESIQLVPRTSPHEWEVDIASAQELESFLLRRAAAKAARDERPRLLDSAMWWFRFAEFAKPVSEHELVSNFISDLGLSKEEYEAIFEPVTAEELGAISFAETCASPSAYLPAGPSPAATVSDASSSATKTATASDGPTQDDLQRVVDYVRSRGYSFEPWQIAAFITAVRSKPFVILAGISGTGKTKLPRLIAEATGAGIAVVPVLASWNDSSDLVGYERVTGGYVPGHLLRIARQATTEKAKEHFLLLDEMNIARVEYYLAEVLSLIEERRLNQEGEIASAPIAPTAEADWASTVLPGNLCLVGSVNMDETTFGFSRKVLDRSFVIEFSDIDLTAVGEVTAIPSIAPWPAAWWRQSALSLADHPGRKSAVVGLVISTLSTINDALGPAQLQVGYRVRDEVAMFCLNAQPYSDAFVAKDASPIDPLDLAITMKVLPRVQGGGPIIRQVLENLLAWANGGVDAAGSSTAAGGPAYPMCAERLTMMLDRLEQTSFTSYWL